MQLHDLLAQPPLLPSLPRAVALLLGELARPEPSLRRLSQLFAIDPTLAARLLQQANRPAHGAPGQVRGIAEALALLDVPQLRMLVQSAAVGTSARSVPGVDLQQFWRYSLHTAKLARALAGVVQHHPLAAYSAGLLHALGELALHLADPQRMQAIASLAGPLDWRRGRLEQHLLGYSYADVGAGLARGWGLPQDVVDALQHHITPFDNEVCEPLAGVLHLAAWRARTDAAGLDAGATVASFPGEVGVALGMDIDLVLQQDAIDWTDQSPSPEALLQEPWVD
ncbi:HD-like signal output (HDOD) domain, no enzymatic activity [Oryzisolibacter propanilivorax]|uniref:HD-like signal output (HDOD) domain, no enzymatic activity n=1 Tax=Oryzisolibacter propanilivorax TaxID=1527607 RepID=A0A1G9UDT6_9BURK|nr:HDOD domain-containing protein [Oryzisolibacter propanilivorax]SDM58121.1 HD-like signal output (HDOD) domain, no enzymatic activity [Oryzisolibacter propanilivorax]